ncbi:unnamed protein product [Haemonchus placei]|uniref:RdRp catalytic domain-containing protein n=1 Tax=Haemonchus placei TaxID=6290 RepID=A0A0N4X722_HAEPC|nr:unnamed protein product [Haemonchus placei]
MDKYLNWIWQMGHQKSSAIDFQTRVKALFFYQRKSGDAATAFGNTLVSMATIARFADVSGFISAYFVGHDSLLFYSQKHDDQQLVKNLSDIFNLSAKSIAKRVGYFCSTFIVDTPDGYVPIPDPLKRVERLGRHLYGVDETGLKDSLFF